MNRHGLTWPEYIAFFFTVICFFVYFSIDEAIKEWKAKRKYKSINLQDFVNKHKDVNLEDIKRFLRDG